MIYLIKNPSERASNIRIILWLENKFAICEAHPDDVVGLVVIDVPDDVFNNMYLYQWPNEKRHRAAICDSRVLMVGPDDAGRWKIQYTDRQLLERAELLRWFASVFIDDMERVEAVDCPQASLLRSELILLNTDEDIKQFTIKKLYYDL